MVNTGLVIQTTVGRLSLNGWLHDVIVNHTHTHTHPFNRPFSGTTRVSRYQKVKPIWNLLKQVTVSGSGISWDICKSALCSSSLQTRCPFCRPTNSVKALKAKRDAHKRNLFPFFCLTICTAVLFLLLAYFTFSAEAT